MRYITGGQPTSREQTRDEIVFLILLPPHAGLSPGFAGCTESGLDGIELIACRVVLFFGLLPGDLGAGELVLRCGQAAAQIRS